MRALKKCPLFCAVGEDAESGGFSRSPSTTEVALLQTLTLYDIERGMNERTSKYVVVAELAYRLAKKTFPQYSHAKSPHYYTLPQLVACVLLMYYVRKTYRDMEEWLLATDKVCQTLDLKTIPDHTTLYRTVKRLKISKLEQMYRILLDALDVDEDQIALDTTGFRPTQASLHYLSRSGIQYKQFYKGGYAVGVASQYILAAVSGIGPGADSPYLAPLRRKAKRYVHRHKYLLLADSGFDGKQVLPGELIPPRRNSGGIQRADRIERFELVSQARLDGLYGQRWKCETVNSVIKRKFGDEVRSRKKLHRHREPIIKGLIYNLHL